MEVPEIQFATASDGVNIAYQVFGDGPPVLFVPGLISNIEIIWENELFRRSMLFAAEHMKVVQFDKRGIGCSDRYHEPPSLDTRIRDILAVMDAAGLERAHLTGMSEGGLMAAQFAVRHPERVDRLIIANAAPGAQRMGEYGERVSQVFGFFGRIVEGWGRDGEVMIEAFNASQRGDPDYAKWWARLARQSGSIDDITRQVENLQILEEPDWSAIRAPTLVVGSSEDPLVPIDISERTAELIRGAEFLSIDTPDHYYFAGNRWREFLTACIEFQLDQPIRHATSRAFATVLFTDIVGSTTSSAAAGDDDWHRVVDSHNRIARRVVDGEGGTYVKSTGDGLLATFPTPSQGVEAARRLHAELGPLGVRIRAGLHTGEIEVHDDDDISGLAVNFAARVEQAAADGTTFVSSTVKDLLLGSHAVFEDRGQHDLKGIDGTWTLYEHTG